MIEVHYYNVELIDGTKETLTWNEYLKLNLTGVVKRAKWSGNDLIISEDEIQRMMNRMTQCDTGSIKHPSNMK